MKNKFIKNVICFILIMTILIVPSASYATTQFENLEPESSIQPRWSYLLECENALYLTEGAYRKLTVYGYTETYEEDAGVYAQLQKLDSDGVNWSDVRNKEWESYSGRYYSYFDHNDISVGAGTYRLFLVHSALDANGAVLETFTAYSDTVTVY